MSDSERQDKQSSEKPSYLDLQEMIYEAPGEEIVAHPKSVFPFLPIDEDDQHFRLFSASMTNEAVVHEIFNGCDPNHAGSVLASTLEQYLIVTFGNGAAERHFIGDLMSLARTSNGDDPLITIEAFKNAVLKLISSHAGTDEVSPLTETPAERLIPNTSECTPDLGITKNEVDSGYMTRQLRHSFIAMDFGNVTELYSQCRRLLEENRILQEQLLELEEKVELSHRVEEELATMKKTLTRNELERKQLSIKLMEQQEAFTEELKQLKNTRKKLVHSHKQEITQLQREIHEKVAANHQLEHEHHHQTEKVKNIVLTTFHQFMERLDLLESSVEVLEHMSQRLELLERDAENLKKSYNKFQVNRMEPVSLAQDLAQSLGYGAVSSTATTASSGLTLAETFFINGRDPEIGEEQAELRSQFVVTKITKSSIGIQTERLQDFERPIVRISTTVPSENRSKLSLLCRGFLFATAMLFLWPILLIIFWFIYALLTITLLLLDCTSDIAGYLLVHSPLRYFFNGRLDDYLELRYYYPPPV